MKKALKTVIFSLFFTAALSQSGYSQTDNTGVQPVEEQPTTEQPADQSPDSSTDQGNQNAYDTPPESVDMAQPVESSPSYVSSPGSSSGSRGTEVIRYYSGSHSGNNVTKKVEVALPEGSTTSSPY